MIDKYQLAWEEHLRTKRSVRNARRSSFDAGVDAGYIAGWNASCEAADALGDMPNPGEPVMPGVDTSAEGKVLAVLHEHVVAETSATSAPGNFVCTCWKWYGGDIRKHQVDIIIKQLGGVS